MLDAISSMIPARYTASAGMYTIPCGTQADPSCANENITAIGVANPNVATSNIVEVGGQFGNRLRDIEGNTPVKPTNPISKSKKLSTGAVAGGVIGGVVWGVLLCIGGVFWYRRRRKTPAPPEPPDLNHQELPGEDRPTNELEGWSVYTPTSKNRRAGEIEYSELANMPPEYQDDDRHQRRHELAG
ncbi:hypothetical protein AA313_de0208513 [Arthrobotrys entomopaga]|nr:hypothetical protein AA313_de0208513 [Arthrobotrys entomopaga]